MVPLIDFRYHVVSLVAVFLALATGIVIGGFSLRGTVADQLNNQVVQLRSEKSSLQDQLNGATQAGVKRDEAIAALTPDAVRGTLDGERVALVLLPETDAQVVETTTAVLKQAGAEVITTVDLTDSMGRPGNDDRDEVVKAQARSLGLGVDETPGDRLSGAVLAKALTSPGQQGSDALSALASKNLVEVDGETTSKVSSVVVLWPKETGDAAEVEHWAGLVSGIGSTADTVVGGSTGPASGAKTAVVDDPLIAAVRDNPTASAAMSTVDHVATDVGRLALALALRDEAAGTSGQYGIGEGSSAVIPRLTK